MIIGLSGYAQTGKDTVAQHLVEKYGYTRIAFADPIREALYALDPVITDIAELPGMRLAWLVDRLGWEFLKQDSGQTRELLQRMGTEVARNQWGQNFWVDLAMKKANSIDKVVITDVRFPNEYDAIIENGGQVWRVSRPGVTAVNGHASETSLDNHTFNRNVLNNGYKQDLYATIDYYMKS